MGVYHSFEKTEDMMEKTHHMKHCTLVVFRDWKIGKYRRYFEEISDIGWHRNDNRHRLLIDGKIGKIADISAKYRWSIDLSEKNREWIWCAEQPEENLKKSPKISLIFWYFYRFFGKFPDISYQSNPRTGYKIWLKNRGFRVREI